MDNRNIDLAKYAGLGYHLIAPILIGVFLGLALDKFFHTKPVLFLLVFFIGVIVSFYNLIKLTKD
jgi:F0F1-type ATP synthase assembly protein I